MQKLKIRKRAILLDGGMGRELRSRGVDVLTAIWSANGLITAPDTVRQIHQDFIWAGADIITTNTYGIIRRNLAQVGLEDHFEALNTLACTLARQARQKSETSVLIAGSLPPLAGSFRPDLVGEIEEIQPLYREQAELLAPHVDLILCETMSSAAEARAAAMAACRTGKPVWVAWTLHDDQSGKLRSGETVGEAVEILSDLPKPCRNWLQRVLSSSVATPIRFSPYLRVGNWKGTSIPTVLSISDLILIPIVTPGMLAAGCRTGPPLLAVAAGPDRPTSLKSAN